jgi:hypothetical protein
MATPSLLLLTLAPSIWSAALVLFALGGLIGGMDVAMNANAVEVEKRRIGAQSCLPVTGSGASAASRRRFGGLCSSQNLAFWPIDVASTVDRLAWSPHGRGF